MHVKYNATAKVYDAAEANSEFDDAHDDFVACMASTVVAPRVGHAVWSVKSFSIGANKTAAFGVGVASPWLSGQQRMPVYVSCVGAFYLKIADDSIRLWPFLGKVNGSELTAVTALENVHPLHATVEFASCVVVKDTLILEPGETNADFEPMVAGFAATAGTGGGTVNAVGCMSVKPYVEDDVVFDPTR